MDRRRVAARSGVGIELARGAELRVIDVEGRQVADLFAFARADVSEHLSSGRSLDYNGTLRLTAGHVLYSDRSNPMLTIVRDDVGVHDFLFAPCSREMFRIQYGIEGEPPNCLENLSNALSAYGVEPSMISTPFNAFMNTLVHEDGRLEVRAPVSAAGDAIVLRAEMDLLVAVSACSAGNCNDHSFTAIDLEIAEPR